MRPKSGITKRERVFAEVLVGGATMAEAYRAAYSVGNSSEETIRRSAKRIGRRPAVKALIEEIRALVRAKVSEKIAGKPKKAKKAPAEAEVAAVAAENIAEAQDRVVDAIAGDKVWITQQLIETVAEGRAAVPVVDSKGEPTGEYRQNLAAAIRALELLGKEIGMFIDRKMAVPFDPLDGLTTEELRAWHDTLQAEQKPAPFPPGNGSGHRTH